MSKVLEIKDLSVAYHTDSGIVKAVNGVSLSLEKGRTLGLVGETGAGKTTIALSVMKLLQSPPAQIHSGQIVFDGQDIVGLSEKQMREIRGKKCSMIFQDPMTALNPIEKVGWQIKEVVKLHVKCSDAEATKKAMDILEMVGIPAQRFDDYPNQFSGGMKQRIVIAIALACEPELLLADEPTTALDVTIQAQVLDLMRNLQQKMGTSVILITHDLGVVAEICDDVAVLYAGTVVESGSVEDIFDHAQHPYTIGLFNSLPKLADTSRRLTPIPGLMPDPTNLPAGCPFWERCSHVIDKCKKEMPKPFIRDGHMVRCHMSNKQEEK